MVVRACGLTHLHMGDSEFLCHCGLSASILMSEVTPLHLECFFILMSERLKMYMWCTHHGTIGGFYFMTCIVRFLLLKACYKVLFFGRYKKNGILNKSLRTLPDLLLFLLICCI